MTIKQPLGIFVLCPVYFDVESFIQLAAEIRRNVASSNFNDRILKFIVVDDSAGSDSEITQLKSLDDVDVVAAPFNMGHQNAIVYGLRNICSQTDPADFVITMDSDGEDLPSDVVPLLQALENDDQGAVVLAMRVSRSEPLLFRMMYQLFRVFFRLLTGLRIKTGNFAAQRAEQLSRTISNPLFDLCYSTSLIAMKRPIIYVPCHRGTRFAGESRMNKSSLITHGIRMLLPFSERVVVRVLALFSILALSTFSSLLLLFVVGVVGVAIAPAIWLLPLVLGILATLSFFAFICFYSSMIQISSMSSKTLI